MKYIITVLFVFICLSTAAQNIKEDKNVFLSKPGHPGVFDSKPVASEVHAKFFFKTNGPVRSTPGILNDKIYFGSGDGYFYCLNLISGNEVWKFNAGSAVNSSPDFENGKVFFTSRDRNLYCLNTETGKLIWKLSLGKDLPYKWGFDYYTSSPTVQNNVVYVGSGDGNLYAVNSENGKEIWKYNLHSLIRCKPSVNSNVVVFGDFSGKLHAVDIKTHKGKWVFEADGSKLNIDDYGFDRAAFISSPVIFENKVFAGCRDGFLYAVNLEDGKLVWKFDDKVSWIISSPSIYESKVITGTSDGKFINAVDVNTGKEIWRTKTHDLVWSSASIAGGIAYFGDYSGNFFAVNSNDGKIIWRFKTGSIIHSSSVIYKNTIYFGSDDGYLYALTGSSEKSNISQNVKRAVYWEDIKTARWFTNKNDEFIRDYFIKEGYTLLNGDSLKLFLEDRIKDKLPSVVILIRNYVPSNVFNDSLKTDPVREYLNAGGKLVMLGPNPFAFVYNNETKKITDIDFGIPNRAFGLKYVGKFTDAIRGWLPAYPTEFGKKLGLKDFWLSTSQVAASSNLNILAKDETGFASAWIKNFGGPEGTGLVQFWVDRNYPLDLYEVFNVAEYGLQ